MSWRRLVAGAGAAIALWSVPIEAALDYMLKARKIAEDTYVFVGRMEDFTYGNGGNIVNTGFIVTRQGVVVIDTGPSKLYGEQMRKAIAAVTPQNIDRVLITHHHPDHFFGNQAFADVPIYALGETIAGMREEGGNFADNLYRMSGDWLKGTEPAAAGLEAKAGVVSIGGHELELVALRGHTRGDLAVFDRSTGVLFAGDLVFHQRAATTPHAEIETWLGALAALQKIPFKLMVPGHGEPVADARGIEQTRRYLVWLESTLRNGAEQGMDMPELLALPIPDEFARIALVRSEYERSIAHLFRAFERAALERKSN
jgi:uncharacterized sulfatase